MCLPSLCRESKLFGWSDATLCRGVSQLRSAALATVVVTWHNFSFRRKRREVYHACPVRKSANPSDYVNRLRFGSLAHQVG